MRKLRYHISKCKEPATPPHPTHPSLGYPAEWTPIKNAKKEKVVTVEVCIIIPFLQVRKLSL